MVASRRTAIIAAVFVGLAVLFQRAVRIPPAAAAIECRDFESLCGDVQDGYYTHVRAALTWAASDAANPYSNAPAEHRQRSRPQEGGSNPQDNPH